MEEGMRIFEKNDQNFFVMNPGDSKEETGQSFLKMKISELEMQIVDITGHYQESVFCLEQTTMETKQLIEKWEVKDKQQQGELTYAERSLNGRILKLQITRSKQRPSRKRLINYRRSSGKSTPRVPLRTK